MVLESAFDHIFAAVDEYHMCALRNAAICGVLAFAFLIVGVNQLITLVIYMFVIAIVCVSIWLYSLGPETRAQVVSRVKDVARAFWRKCVDDSFGERSVNETAQFKYSNTPGRTDAPARKRRRLRRDGRVTFSDSEIQADRIANRCENRVVSKAKREVVLVPKSLDDARDIDELSKEFTSLFQLNSDVERDGESESEA